MKDLVIRKKKNSVVIYWTGNDWTTRFENAYFFITARTAATIARQVGAEAVYVGGGAVSTGATHRGTVHRRERFYNRNVAGRGQYGIG